MATLCSAMSGAYNEQQLIERVAMQLATCPDDDHEADAVGSSPECADSVIGDVPGAESVAGDPPELGESDSEDGDHPNEDLLVDNGYSQVAGAPDYDHGQPPDSGDVPTAGEPSDDVAPRMPCYASPECGHRDKLPAVSLFNACVARPVNPAELKVNEKAKAAMQVE